MKYSGATAVFEEEREGPPEQPTEVSQENEAEALILTHLLQGGCLRCPVLIRRSPITSSLGPKRPDIDKNPGQSQHCLKPCVCCSTAFCYCLVTPASGTRLVNREMFHNNKYFTNYGLGGLQFSSHFFTIQAFFW